MKVRGSIVKLTADKNYGPVIMPQSFVADSLRSEMNNSTFEQVSADTLYNDLCVAYDRLDNLLRPARELCKVDPQTSKYLWSGLSAMPINSSINAVLRWMADKFGNIRYLPKLHKPRLEMRRIEADTRSPFKTVATYVAMILNRIARTFGMSHGPDRSGFATFHGTIRKGGKKVFH